MTTKVCSDLHIHSLHSDGEWTVEELIKEAKNKGLYAMALTDHDTVKGVKEALFFGEKYGVNVIKGLELSSIKVGDVHILGYGINVDDEDLLSKLDEIVEKRGARNRAILAKLSELGMPIDEKELLKIGEGKIIGRKLISDLMIKKGYVKTVSEAFEKYLGSAKPAYVPLVRLTPIDAIKLIHSAGGVAVLAHPSKLLFKGEELERFIEELALNGLDGIEGYYYTHSEKEVEYYSNLAQKHGLFMTGGSDFHGMYRSSRIGDTSGKTDKSVLDMLIGKSK